MLKRVPPAALALLITFAVIGLLGVERAQAQEPEPATPIAVIEETGAVAITVIDQNGAPVAGAEISLFHGQDAPLVAQTGPSGIIEFEQLVPGNYSGSVSANGRGTVEIAVFEVVAGEVFEPTVTLLPLAEITVVVTNRTGAPVNGARITLTRNQDPPIVGTTGSGGEFVFTGLTSGTYGGSVTANGYGQAGIESFTVNNGDLLRVEVTLPPPPPGSILFTVTDEHGSVMPGALLELYDDTTNTYAGGLWTDSTGKVLFEGLQPGSYYATVDVNGYYRGFPENIIVQFGIRTDVTVKLEKQPPPTTGAITVRVVLNGQEVRRGGTVNIYGKTTTSRSLSPIGETNFTDVQPGAYVIEVDANGLGRKVVGPFEVAAGQNLDQVIDIGERSPDDTGTVVVETYTQEQYPRPLANVQVTLTGLTTSFSRTLVSDATGTLVFQDIPPADYDVQALALDTNNVPYGEEAGNVEVTAGAVSLMTVHIDGSPEPGTASMTIAVVDQEDGPIAGASVSVETSLGSISLQSGFSGYAFATDFPPGDVIVIASASGYVASDPVAVAVGAGTRASVTIRLSPVEQAPEPTPVQPTQPASQAVVQLPSTGAGSGANSWWLTMSLLLVVAAGIAMLGGGWVRRR